MTEISLYTPVVFERPSTCTEGVLSTLSSVFYLGGQEAVVVRDDEVRMIDGDISNCAIAMKVAAYILLFPLTLALFALHLVLRCQHNFTIIPPTPPRPESTPAVTREEPIVSSTTLNRSQPQAPSQETHLQLHPQFQPPHLQRRLEKNPLYLVLVPLSTDPNPRPLRKKHGLQPCPKLQPPHLQRRLEKNPLYLVLVPLSTDPNPRLLHKKHDLRPRPQLQPLRL